MRRISSEIGFFTVTPKRLRPGGIGLALILK